MSPADLGQAFLNRTLIPGVRFQRNNFVRITGGTHAGKAGSLVTVLSLSPEPLFVVERESGYDVHVSQSELALISER
jgi:ribosomal protein S4E